jgi:hypothetical protein
MPLTDKQTALYHKAVAADDAWSRELRRCFGPGAGDARYSAKGKGEPGTKLRRLHDAWQKWNERWRAESKKVMGF